MKKLKILFILILTIPLSLFSQDEEVIYESQFHPVMGSIGIGIDAAPIINIFADDNPLNFDDNTLFLRYFISHDAALRLNMGIRNVKTSTTFYVQDDDAFMNDPLSRKQVQDRRMRYDTRYNIDLGYQMFFGENRMRGFVGGSIGYQYEMVYSTYEYGNAMNSLNDAPTHVVNWLTGNTGNFNDRTLKDFVTPASHSIGAGLFTGAEYFLVPQFCIGLEVGLGYSLVLPSQDYREYETMVGDSHLEMTDVYSIGIRERSFGTEIPYYGRFYLFFHF